MFPECFGQIANALEINEVPQTHREYILRACVGRHYYEVFHKIQNWLIKDYPEIFKAGGGGTHQALQVSCELLAEKLNDPRFDKLALKLKVLHSERIKADYFLDSVYGEGGLITVKAEKNRLNILLDDILKNPSTSVA
ncbi:hypothetical protein ABFO63_10345 [Acinetobacter junii]|uniref:hypothetical protein n=1 Tax=Acinetobacter junii TaxID=40215 RepID=UPI003213AB02